MAELEAIKTAGSFFEIAKQIDWWDIVLAFAGGAMIGGIVGVLAELLRGLF